MEKEAIGKEKTLFNSAGFSDASKKGMLMHATMCKPGTPASICGQGDPEIKTWLSKPANQTKLFQDLGKTKAPSLQNDPAKRSAEVARLHTEIVKHNENTWAQSTKQHLGW